MPATILNSVFAHGGRASRYGDFTIVFMHNCSFVTTPLEFVQMQSWARGRMSCGNATRDRSLFVDRFDTVIGRNGSGIGHKGNPVALARLAKSMAANGVLMDEWNVPRTTVGVEIRKRAARLGRVTDAPAPANEPRPGPLAPIRS